MSLNIIFWWMNDYSDMENLKKNLKKPGQLPFATQNSKNTIPFYYH